MKFVEVTMKSLYSNNITNHKKINKNIFGLVVSIKSGELTIIRNSSYKDENYEGYTKTYLIEGHKNDSIIECEYRHIKQEDIWKLFISMNKNCDSELETKFKEGICKFLE